MAKVLTQQNGDVVATLAGSTELEDGAVTSAKIAANAVGSGHIADGEIATADLADGAVASAKVAANGIGGAHIADGEIATADLANGAVASAKVGTGAIGGAHIADGEIVSSDVAGNAIGGAHIADGEIVSSDIAASQIGATHITDGEVGSAEIATGAVTSSEIAAGAVGADEIIDGSVNTAELADAGVTSAKIGASQIGTDHIQDGSVTSADISPTYAPPTNNLRFNTLTAAEAIDEGAPIAIQDGVENNIVEALATTAGAMPVVGIAESAINSGDTGTVSLGTEKAGYSAQVSGYVGEYVFAHATSAGKLTVTAPNTSGDIQQRVGKVISNNEAYVQPDDTPVIIN